MGIWFAKFFASKGFTVYGYSRSQQRLNEAKTELIQAGMDKNCIFSINIEDSVKNASWIMLSIPVPAHESVIKKIAPLMKKDAVLLDIASVKSNIIECLYDAKKKYDIHVLSTHPMFGPGAANMKNKNFILINLEEDELVKDEFKSIIQKEHPSIIESTPQEHDMMISFTLGVPHFLNILFGNILKDGDTTLERMTKFGGTTFHLQHLISQEVVSQEPYIYATIQMENSHFLQQLNKLRKNLDRLLEIIQNKKYDVFINDFKEIREYYGKISEFQSVMKRFNSAAQTSLEIIKSDDESHGK